MLIIIGVGILLLLILTIVMKTNGTLSFDVAILNFIHSKKSTGLDIFFNSFAWLGSLWVLLPTIIAFTISLLFHEYVMPALVLNVGFMASVVTAYMMKYALRRERPSFFEDIEDVPHDPSYPSAHTTQAFAFASMFGIVTYMLNPSSELSLCIVFLGFALAVASSQLYLRLHFPSDVLAGMLIASIWAGIAMYFVKLGVFV